MWYVKLNGNILPTPYQRFEDCMEEVRRLQNTNAPYRPSGRNK